MTSVVMVEGVIRSNLLIFMLGGGICVVGCGNGIHSLFVVLLSPTTSTQIFVVILA